MKDRYLLKMLNYPVLYLKLERMFLKQLSGTKLSFRSHFNGIENVGYRFCRTNQRVNELKIPNGQLTKGSESIMSLWRKKWETYPLSFPKTNSNLLSEFAWRDSITRTNRDGNGSKVRATKIKKEVQNYILRPERIWRLKEVLQSNHDK